MSIFQFFTILWARRWIVVVATICSVLGALVVTRIVPPTWDGTARVMLDLLKPDPVTGEVINGPASRNYIATQVALITDYTVAGATVDQLGMLSDPQLIRAYQQRSSKDARDFRHWLADRIIERTKAKVLPGSNILEIDYAGSAPEQAKSTVEAIRRAYIDTSGDFKRADASRNADWYAGQVQAARRALDTAEGAKDDFERQNGIIMDDDKTDIETARLKALVGEGSATPVAPAAAQVSAADSELAQLDAEIEQDSKTLGPNHPELQALKARRAAVASLAERQRQDSARADAAAGAAAAAAGVHAIEQQKQRVIAERGKLGTLEQLQADVDLRRDELNKSQAKVAELRMEAVADDTGLTPLSGATVPPKPTFPNMPLIMFGSLGLGFGLGCLVALLTELLRRRVRSPDDLRQLSDAPLLAVVSLPADPVSAPRGGLRRLVPSRRDSLRARA